MKKIWFIATLWVSALALIFSFTPLHSDGSVTDDTGSPVDGNRFSCRGCHGGGASFTCSPSISATPAFGPGNTYTPNATYTIAIGESGAPYFGFDLEICSKNSTVCTDGGTFLAAGANCQIHAPLSPHTTNVTHTAAIAGSSKASFTWKAPASGNCYVYLVELGANGNGMSSGDMVVNDSIVLSASPTGIADAAANNPQSLNLFPNPASGQLQIAYTLSQHAVVAIHLYDLSGKFVSSLFNGEQEAGEQSYSAVLPASLDKGMYLLQLEVDGKLSVKRLVLK
jgi:hypothetical protein